MATGKEIEYLNNIKTWKLVDKIQGKKGFGSKVDLH